jgi:hypothetical protein
VLHQGNSVGGGRFGLARYVHATRLVTQPAAAVLRGRLLLALQSSTSPLFGDPAAGSEINLLFSRDGGNHWEEPFKVARSTPADPQHVHPSITLDEDGERATIAYYVQQADSKLRTDLASVEIEGHHLRLEAQDHLSDTAFDMTPSNIPFPIAGNPFFTTNYDRTVRACYNIGEYMSVQSERDGRVIAAWGDNRRQWLSPAGSPAAGTHAQADVFAGPAGGGDKGKENGKDNGKKDEK